MKQYKYFLFDLDGTLVDSSPSVYGSLRAMEASLGLVPVAENMLHRFVGPPLAESFRIYYHATEAEIPGMLAVYRKDYKERSHTLTTPYPGVVELLRHIKSTGCHAAVATLKELGAATVTMNDLDVWDCIDHIAALEDGGKTSKADLIEECLAFYGNPPKEQAVFFGDSPYDGVGARETGLDFVALTYGFGFLEPGSLDGIPYVLDAKKPMELLDFIKDTAKPE